MNNSTERFDMWKRIELAFVDPRILRELSGNNNYLTELGPKGEINFETFQLGSTTLAAPGTKIRIRIDRNFEWCLESDYQGELGQRLERQNEADKKRKEQQDNKRDIAKEFYEGLKLPYRFDVARKDVLSGLTENSLGDGTNRRTVLHLLLLEDFSKGKFSRKEGDYLCTSGSISNGKNYSDSNQDPIRFFDGANQKYMPSVTCKKCLELIQKHNGKTGCG